MNVTRWIAGLFVMFAMTGHGEIKRISDGGVSVNLAAIIPDNEPAVLVFHTPWDQSSITLLERIEDWASSYPSLAIFFIDVVDERTSSYRQFSLQQVPTVLIFDRDQNQIGESIDDVEKLEEALTRAGFI